MQEKSSKVIAIVALCVGVVGLSLGFAAFTDNLSIEDAGATYTPEATQFTSHFGFAKEGVTGGNVAADYSKSWTGVTAAFTGLNQTQEFEATILNDSPYLATTTNTSFELVQISCEAAEGATVTEEYVDATCAEITATVTFPATIARDSSGKATVTVVGPKNNAVDGQIVVKFDTVTAQYTTAQ